MSGRWRSRHWKAGECGDDDGGERRRLRDASDLSRERPHDMNKNNNNGWSRDKDDGQLQYNRNNAGRYSRRDDEYQQPQRHQPPYNNNSSSTPQHSEGEWRRGQTLPTSNSRAGERMPPGNNGHQRTKQGPASNNRPVATGGSSRPVFSAPPKQAWGSVNGSDKHPSQTKDAKNIPEKKVWAKPVDSNNSNNTGTTAIAKTTNAWGNPKSSLQQAVSSGKTSSSTQSINNKESSYPTLKSSNPWGTKTASNDTTKKPMVAIDDSAFPPVNNTKVGNGTNKQPTAILVKGGEKGSLPSTSSWGKSNPPQSVASSRLTNPPSSKGKKKEVKVDEFPSLSTASKMPQQTQQHATTQIRSSAQAAKAVTPITTSNNDKPSKGQKGSSKKSATTANLASFLVPQTSKASGSGKGSNNKRKQLQQQSNKQTSTTASMLSFNRVNSINNNKVEANHPGMMSSMVGMKRSSSESGVGGSSNMNFPNTSGKGGAGAIKKGRQRLAPRKKKLTTLKKKVLKERLRVWKERNGIVDNDDGDTGMKGTTADDGINPSDEQGLGSGNGQPTKRLKTDGIQHDIASSSSDVSKLTTLLIENFIRPEEDDLTDDDEYDEIISNLISLSGRVGKVISVFVPRPQQHLTDFQESMESEDSSSILLENKHVGLAFVRYASSNDVCAAKDILDRMVVGGDKIRTTILDATEMLQFNVNSTDGDLVAPSADNDKQWRAAALRVVDDRRASMDVNGSRDLQPNSSTNTVVESSVEMTIVFHNILCDDDYDDEEALQESIEDIKGLAEQYGQVDDARAATTGKDKGNVYIVYRERDAAEKALQQLNGIVLGGSKVMVSKFTDVPLDRLSQAGEVVLSNVLNGDDFEDEDCLNESLEDIRTLAEQFGTISSVRAEVSGEQKGNVYVSYLDGHQVAEQAVQRMNGMVIGGLTISAALVVTSSSEDCRGSTQVNEPLQDENKCEHKQPPPMYSGDKIVPEQFAACKRVPKVPNPGTPRSYASKIADETAAPLLIEMLGELMRLQERSKDDKNARARRRLVMGLREVARGIRAHKVKMVIMANNLDQYGAIDSKLQEILDLARAEDLPILYELNKRKLGKALGKSIKVSVVGIQNADGAHEPFKKLKKMLV